MMFTSPFLRAAIALDVSGITLNITRFNAGGPTGGISGEPP